MFLALFIFFFLSPGLSHFYTHRYFFFLSLYPHNGKATSLPRFYYYTTRAQIIHTRRRHAQTHTHLSLSLSLSRLFSSRLFIIYAHTRTCEQELFQSLFLEKGKETERERRNTHSFIHTCLLRRVNVSSGTLNDFNRIHLLGFPVHRRSRTSCCGTRSCLVRKTRLGKAGRLN